MPTYPLECPDCKFEDELIWSITDYDNLPIPLCSACGQRMEQRVCSSTIIFAFTPGKRTGVYKHDYGTYATHDLTVPGKMEELTKAGIIADPFEGTSPISELPGAEGTYA
jgi:predicted nucleic acid-binding Zn ribbon protein